MKRIKVIHVITRFDKGGSAENTFLTVKGLDREKYDVLLIKGPLAASDLTPQEGLAVERNLREVSESGVRIITLDSLVRNVSLLNDVAALKSLVGLFLRERPPIVHTHTSKAGILGRWAAFLSKVPVIIHTPHGHVFWGYFNGWETRLFIFIERITARRTDAIITLTEQEKRDHLRFRIAPENRFSVIHSGIDGKNLLTMPSDPAAMKLELGIPDHAFIVGTVGRLTPVKGHRYLLEAAKEILTANPDCYFVFLGDGEISSELQDYARVLGIKDNVRFPGWRPDVGAVMSVFDIFSLPSLNEGMGRVLVEAMMLGKPVVASRVGGILDLVRDNDNGLLVSPSDPQSLAAGISALANDPEKRRRLGERGRETAASFTSEAMVRKIEDLYEHWIRSKNLGTG